MLSSVPLRLPATIITLGAALLLATSCASSSAAEDTVTVAAASEPHAEILQHAEDTGLLDNTKLDIHILSSAPEANLAVSNGSADVNYIQHTPYFEDWAAENPVDNLVSLGDIHIEPMSAYSRQISSLDELPENAQVLLPKSGSNFARGLLLLERAGVIALDPSIPRRALSKITLADVAENPKNLRLSDVDDDIVPHALDDPDVSVALMSTAFALQAGLVDLAIETESPDNNPYGNILVASTGSAENPNVRKVVEALQSPEMAEWIEKEYEGLVLPTHK
ncbi:MetQ/NlpA family ABC transporter substrate-binding protein [Corynebacterium flavescens]|uniref:MetQ/NlpA family ABC transporter substrate-binding protein n=1 Tax=Corynebacterium flavescens TaxID=28028 RepID=UPI003FCFE6F9